MINELDGLAKGPEMEHRAAGYARQVQERARKSIEFLEERFESRDNCLRALTSRGNELESISFRSEDTTGQQVRDAPSPGGQDVEAAMPRAGGSLSPPPWGKPGTLGSVSSGQGGALSPPLQHLSCSTVSQGSTEVGGWQGCRSSPAKGNVACFFQGNNDDLILSCCLHYCNDKAKDFMPANKGSKSSPPLCLFSVAFHRLFSFLFHGPWSRSLTHFASFDTQVPPPASSQPQAVALPPVCQMCTSPHSGDALTCEKPTVNVHRALLWCQQR